MAGADKKQLSSILDHDNPKEVFNETKKIFTYNYSPESFSIVEHVYGIVSSLYKGSFPGYRGCNTEYHNFIHVNHVLLATARIVDGLHIYEGAFDETQAVNLLVASLLHDIGYLQETNDIEGTGAKYTTTHVYRGMAFTKKNSETLKLLPEDLPKITSLIECTCITPDPIDKLTGEDLLCGAIIATADIIGQMSDRRYLEKLLFLYYEFVEAGIGGYNTAFDILKKTHLFYQTTKDRLNGKLCSFYDLAKYHFKMRFDIDENLYIVAIERQMDYLQKIIDDTNGNFRNKLYRIDIKDKN